MTRYETIQHLGEEFIMLISKGFIPVHLLDWKVYYEAYLKESALQRTKYGRVRKTHVACTIADEFNISERSVFTVIAFMES